MIRKIHTQATNEELAPPSAETVDIHNLWTLRFTAKKLASLGVMMLRATVEIFPSGNESSRRVLAHADISNVKSGPLVNYKIRLSHEILGDLDAVTLRDYPRMAATIWDRGGSGNSDSSLSGKAGA
ncbi:hypothetical protein [Paraburkholderia sp. BL6669N2]|uniref:hypothetical protein n=1 Tax=Paraburkholderia sp. BL6669N2 TaxID=1938807 RepID=UPI0011C0708F|nr:hypothetical protein [Paraburkholderia sp. BL6669N2]